jgi:hypothetical protein
MSTCFRRMPMLERALFASMSCTVVLLISSVIYGQFTTVINSPPTIIGDGQGIGSDTQLNVFDGGAIGDEFRAGARDVSSDNTEVNIAGGSVGDGFHAYSGTRVNINGGSVRQIGAYPGTQVIIAGGSVGPGFCAAESQVTITGGSVREIGARPGSQVTIIGGEFRLDGVPVEGLGSVGASVARDVPSDALLSGVLSDGTPLAFSCGDYRGPHCCGFAAGTLTLMSSELPPIGPALVTASTDPVPLGIRQGQTLVVNSNGVVSDNFNAGLGSTVTIEEGGIVGDNLEAVGATVDISGGSVGEGFRVHASSQVNIYGGSVGDGFQAHNGSQVTIFGGSVGDGFWTSDSEVTISGGSVGAHFRAWDGSQVIISDGSVGHGFSGSQVTITGGSVGNGFSAGQVTISGGSVGDWFSGGQVTISGGSVGNHFEAGDGSQVNLIGTEFFLDGELVADLVVGEPLTLADRDVWLSGHLADGSPFSFELNSERADDRDYFSPDATLTVTLVPEPSSIVLAIAAILLTGACLRECSVRKGFLMSICRCCRPPFQRIPFTLLVCIVLATTTVYGQFTTVINSPPTIIGDNESIGSGTLLNVFDDGIVGNNFSAEDAEVNFWGGSVGYFFAAGLGTQVNIYGGSFGGRFTVDNATIYGGEFRLDGVPVEGLGSVGARAEFDFPRYMPRLSGVLADGTPFAFGVEAWSYNDHFRTLTLVSSELPPVGPPLITASSDRVPLGIRDGQTLVVDAGGVVTDNFNAGIGSTVTIEDGGIVGSNLEAVGAAVNISGGSVGGFDAFNGSQVTISGGSVGGGIQAYDGSQVTISGGSVEGEFWARDGSQVTISGGSVGIHALDSQVTVSGGSVHLYAGSGSQVTISGGEFRVDGVPVEGLGSVGTSMALELPDHALLSGVLSDGTPFAFLGGGDANCGFLFGCGSWSLASSTLPPPGPSLITASSDPVPLGIRDGQTLVVDSGGMVPDNFTAGWGSAVTIEQGGIVGSDFEAVGAEVTITGGSVGEQFGAFYGSEVTITGGSVGHEFSAHDGSLVTISGGSIGYWFNALGGSQVNIIGTEFLLDGEIIENLVVGDPLTLADRDVTLSGHLLDGSRFSWFLNSNALGGGDVCVQDAIVVLTLVPEPSCIVLAIAAFLLTTVCLRERTAPFSS